MDSVIVRVADAKFRGTSALTMINPAIIIAFIAMPIRPADESCIIEPIRYVAFWAYLNLLGLSESADKKKNQGQDNTYDDAAGKREIKAEIIPLNGDIAGKPANKRNPWAIDYNDSCYYQNNSCYKQKLTGWCKGVHCLIDHSLLT